MTTPIARTIAPTRLPHRNASTNAWFATSTSDAESCFAFGTGCFASCCEAPMAPPSEFFAASTAALGAALPAKKSPILLP